jgi:hypothetical protein
MERHQRIQLKTTSRSINQPVSVSSFQTRGFGVQQKAASTPASKAELWENYQRSSQMTQQGAGRTRSAIQTKLTIGQPGDKYEQEADSVADRVMAMSEPAQVQREELGEEEEELQMKPLAGMISPLVQREELPEEEEELQMKPDDRAIQREDLPEEEEELQMKSLDNSIQREALPEEEEELQMKESPTPNSQLPTSSLEDRLSSSKGGGSPLSDDVRSFMEPRFGADFSGVRVHTGSDAVQMNQDVSAQAFAHGQDVYFGAGKAPGKDALTAHELTHVVQQTGANPISIQQRGDLVARKSIKPTKSSLIQRDDSKAVSSPSPTQSGAVTASPQNPVVAAMWDGQVVQPLKGAAKLLARGGAESARTAKDRLFDVRNFIVPLIATYRSQGKESTARILDADNNGLRSLEIDISSRLGNLIDLPQMGERASKSADIFQGATEEIAREGTTGTTATGQTNQPGLSAGLGPVGSMIGDLFGSTDVERVSQQQIIAVMWQSGVVFPEQGIAGMLGQPEAGKSEAKTALARTNNILSTLRYMRGIYLTKGNKVTENQFLSFIEMMQIQKSAIQPHLGVTRSLSKTGLFVDAYADLMSNQATEL